VAGAAAAAEGESGDVERIRDEDEDGRRDVGRSANMAGRKTAQTGLCSDIRPPPRNLTDIYPGKFPPPDNTILGIPFSHGLDYRVIVCGLRLRLRK